MMCFFLLYYRRNSFPGRLCQNCPYVKIDICLPCVLRIPTSRTYSVLSEVLTLFRTKIRDIQIQFSLVRIDAGFGSALADIIPNRTNEKGPSSRMNLNFDGEGGIWTPAPCNRPTPLAGAPLRPLEYFSKARTANVKSYRSLCGILHAVSICLTTLCYYTREIFPCQLIYIIFHRCYNIKALQV